MMTTQHKCFKYFNLEGARIPIEDFVLAWQKSASTREVCERLKVQVPTDKTCSKIANKFIGHIAGIIGSGINVLISLED